MFDHTDKLEIFRTIGHLSYFAHFKEGGTHRSCHNCSVFILYYSDKESENCVTLLSHDTLLLCTGNIKPPTVEQEVEQNLTHQHNDILLKSKWANI